MWNRWYKYAFFLMTGFLILIIPRTIQAFPDELCKEYTDSAVIGKKRLININSKKANIKITRWDRQEVWVKARIIFKNSDPDVARKELEYVRYNFLKTVPGINISNYFSLPPGTEKIQSVVTVEYQIFLPEKVTIVVNNEYGSCYIEDMEAFVNLNNKYGNILLNGIKGQVRIFAALCDVRLNNFSGDFELYSSNSDISLKNINGHVKVENKVGTIILEPGDNLDHLEVNSTHSEIDLVIRDISIFNYELLAKNSTIELDPAFRHFQWQVNTKDHLVYLLENTNRLIEIFTIFNRIKLNQYENGN